MATADKVTVELEAKRGKFDRDIEGARSKFEREMGRISGSAQQAERSIRASSGQISSSLRSLASGLAAGATVGAVARLADGYTTLQNRLRVVGLEGAALENVQNRLYEAGNRNGVAVGDLAQLYSRVALSAGELGASQSQLLSLTDGVTAALRVQGVSAQEASGPLLQLGQALGAGIVRAEEYNSIIEGVPVLAQAAAKGLERTGGSVAKLRTEVIEGRVSSQEFFQALLRGLPDVEKQAEKSTLTIAQSFQTLNNELGRWVGQTDQSLSASQRLSQGIVLLANNLDKIIPAVSALTVFLGTRYVAAGVAAAATSINKARADALATQNAIAYTAAVNAQAAANARLVATGGAATAALKYQAATTLTAGAAARAFGTGLIGLAGGPVGIATIAVAGLAAGIGFLIQQNSDAAISARALQAVEERSLPTKTKLEKLTLELATASRDRAAAIREEINELINLERVELARLKAVADAERRNANTGTQTARFGSGMGVESYLSARDQAALQRELELRPHANDAAGDRETAATRRANAEYEAQKSVVEGLEEALKDATEARKTLTEAEDKANKGKGKTAEQLAREAEQRARLIADLELQTALEEASLAQDVARVRELERQAEITQRIRQLEDAGLSAADARARSDKIQSRLDKARADDLERITNEQARSVDRTIAEIGENYERLRQIEREEELEGLIAAHKEAGKNSSAAEYAARTDQNIIEQARLDAAERYLRTQQAGHALRIAELTGNDRLVKQLRDAEEIERRTAEYRAQGRLSQDQARNQATQEVSAERAAATFGEQRDFFASAFSEGIRAAWAGDLEGFLTSQFGNLADMALRRLGESLFDSISEAPAAIAKAQAEGAAQGSAIAITVGPAITSAAVIAGNTMGGSIVTAGAIAAKAIAAATAVGGLRFPKFAAGTNFAPGGLSVVGEQGPELVNLPRGAQVIPNHRLSLGQRNQQPIVRLVVEEGAMFVPRVQSVAGPIAVQASTTGVLYSQDQQQTANKRQGQSFIR